MIFENKSPDYFITLQNVNFQRKIYVNAYGKGWKSLNIAVSLEMMSHFYLVICLFVVISYFILAKKNYIICKYNNCIHNSIYIDFLFQNVEEKALEDKVFFIHSFKVRRNIQLLYLWRFN